MRLTEHPETDRSLSVEEFWALPEEEGFRLELSRGRLVREPAPGPRHGHLSLRLGRLLSSFVEKRDLGFVFADTAFALETEQRTVRVPDVAFVSRERVPEEGLTDRFWELAPDLAVEVVSPSNLASELQQKALDYLRAGARLVWIVDPAQRTVAVYRSRLDIRVLVEGEVLEGDDVLPDLRVAVEEIFR